MRVKGTERIPAMSSSDLGLIPDWLIIGSFCARSLRLWGVLRLGLSFVFILAGDDPLHLSTPATLAIAMLASFLALLDVHRSRELSLIGNLGVSRGILAALVSAPPFISEGILLVLGRIA